MNENDIARYPVSCMKDFFQVSKLIINTQIFWKTSKKSLKHQFLTVSKNIRI